MTSPFASDLTGQFHTFAGLVRRSALCGVAVAACGLGGCASPVLAEVQAEATALMRGTPEWFEAAAAEVSGRGYPSLSSLPAEPAPPPTEAEWARRLKQLGETGRQLNALAFTAYTADAATLLEFSRAQAARLEPGPSPDPTLLETTDIAAWAAAQRARVTRDDLDVE